MLLEESVCMGKGVRDASLLFFACILLSLWECTLCSAHAVCSFGSRAGQGCEMRVCVRSASRCEIAAK